MNWPIYMWICYVLRLLICFKNFVPSIFLYICVFSLHSFRKLRRFSLSNFMSFQICLQQINNVIPRYHLKIALIWQIKYFYLGQKSFYIHLNDEVYLCCCFRTKELQSIILHHLLKWSTLSFPKATPTYHYHQMIKIMSSTNFNMWKVPMQCWGRKKGKL